MRASPGEYLSLKLRTHELLHGFPLYDVWVVDLPGGGAGRSVADIRALDSAVAPSRIANAFYRVRRFLGRAFGWDRVQMRPNPTAPSYGHVVCQYAEEPGTSCGGGDPWVNCYNGNGPGTGLDHTGGAAAAP